MFTKDTLKGKSILITGGGSGLGLGMARAFAEHGANIAICGRTEEKLKKAAESIGEFGTKVLWHSVDVRDYEAVSEMMKSLKTEFGELNGLVNNAAGNFYCPSEELTPNGFKAVVDIVLTGSFNCSQTFGAQLIEDEKPGNIINIVTTYTETGCAFVLPSACAKAGVYAMTNSLAYEWATYGIRVNAIAPGPFPTEGAWKRLMPDENFEKMYLKRHPMNRYGEPEELNNLAVFMMSDLSPYMTGECVNIDGAERLQGAQFNMVAQMMPRKQLKQVFQMMRPKK
ncbi:MAG: SDR family oxidoreductase [Calditrichia bacterium]